MTFIGAVGMFFMWITGHKIVVYNGSLCCRCGKGAWGGVNFGPFFFTSYSAVEHTFRHEWGHGVQNAVYGPLFLFIVAIPSFVRYHYRNFVVATKRKKYSALPPYDAIWFENEATTLGNKYCIEK